MKKARPIIFDTDIGSDIDDSWALVMALKSPELDIKLVTVNGYDTVYQAKVTAKMLEAAGRTDIPIAIGRSVPEDGPCVIERWLGEYDLASYPNVIGGVGDAGKAIVDCVMASDEEITILGIGTFRNMEDAYKINPAITKKSTLALIAGNIFATAFVGWHPALSGEWNIRHDLSAWRNGVEKTDWEVELIPLDVSGNVKFVKEQYDKVKETAENDPLLRALVDSNETFLDVENWDCQGGTSPLFDTVGVYALITHDHMKYQRLPIYANDESISLIDPERGKDMDVAIGWEDKEKFYKFLLARLCNEI